MNPKDSPSTESGDEGRPQPFLDFKTMPGGWDLSGQPARPRQAQSAQPAEPGDSCDAASEAAPGDVSGQAQKFTKPRTIPTHWDTSALK